MEPRVNWRILYFTAEAQVLGGLVPHRVLGVTIGTLPEHLLIRKELLGDEILLFLK